MIQNKFLNLGKYLFSIVPQRSQRFFTLVFNLKQIPITQPILNQYVQHQKKYQNTGAIMLSLKKPQNNQYTLFFQSKNQTQPFDYIKQSPYQKHQLIQNYSIKQFQMEPRVRDKQIAPKYLRE